MLKVVYVRKGDITYLWYFQHFLCSCIMYAIIEQILHAALQPKKKIVNVILFPEITDYPDILDVLLKTRICWLSLKLTRVHIKKKSVATEREQDHINFF